MLGLEARATDAHNAARWQTVERVLCGDGDDLKLGARRTALRELREESGICLPDTVDLMELRVAPGAYWGENTHFNFAFVFSARPEVTGPEPDSVHELVHGGMRIGVPAGDGYHAWVHLSELLAHKELMAACRDPIMHFLQEYGQSPVPKMDVRPTVTVRPSSKFNRARTEGLRYPAFPPPKPSRQPPELEAEVPAKRPRGSLARAYDP
ncbi:unnamed protein product [Durusdinium trenchii]|uniref:Nudix hydrolase domain-containing protein n=1 Tax=Durusdinium trenchii TaxID=1381693 RepID=A0ABP0IGN6_9DINO